jgi:hypothetical protein
MVKERKRVRKNRFRIGLIVIAMALLFFNNLSIIFSVTFNLASMPLINLLIF